MITKVINSLYLTIKNAEAAKSYAARLVIIIDFFKKCEAEGIDANNNYFLTKLSPVLISIFNSSNINFIDPSYLLRSREILLMYEELEGNPVVTEQIKKVTSFIDIQLLKLYSYLGELGEGLLLLNEIIKINENKKNNVSENIISSEVKKKINISKALLDKRSLKENRAIKIIEEIQTELKKINSFSAGKANVMLAEYGNEQLTGSIQNIIFEPVEIKNENNEDILIYSDEFKDKIKTAAGILLNRLNENINLYENNFYLKFPSSGIRYKGTSFGLSAVMAVLSGMLLNNDKKTKVYINNSCAFTGILGENGNILPVESTMLHAKISACYFSWINYAIVPDKNHDEALQITLGLKALYPNKKFEIIPVSNVKDIIDNNKIVKIEKEKNSGYYFRKFINNKAASLTSLIVLLTVIIFLLMSYLIPEKVKPLPVTNAGLNLIFTPDRDTVMLFNNHPNAETDVLNMGEVSLGDNWFNVIELWNNSDKQQQFEFITEGADNDEFEILIGSQDTSLKITANVPADTMRRFFVKFSPYSSEGEKNAELKIINTEEQQVIKTIKLKGSAGILKSGYSLLLTENDNMITVKPGLNLIDNNFTFSMWIKPDKDAFDGNSIAIMRDDNEELTNNKLTLYIANDSILWMTVFDRKASQNVSRYFPSINKVKQDEWNFISAGVRDSVLYLVLNDELRKFYIEPNSIRAFSDNIYFGYNPDGIHSKKGSFLLDEFRIYDEYIEPEMIQNNRYDKNYKFTSKLILYYDFEQGDAMEIFDVTGSDYWAEPAGLTIRILENAPFIESEKEKFSDNSIQLEGAGLIKLSNNIFRKPSDFTFEFDMKVDDWKDTLEQPAMYIMQPGGDVNFQLSPQKAYIDYRIKSAEYALWKETNYQAGNEWHNYIFTYSNDKKNIALIIDGREMIKAACEAPFNINRLFWGLAFGRNSFYHAPRFIGRTITMDNIKIYDKYYAPGIQPIAFWDFENIQDNIAYDKIQNLPVIMFDKWKVVGR